MEDLRFFTHYLTQIKGLGRKGIIELFDYYGNVQNLHNNHLKELTDLNLKTQIINAKKLASLDNKPINLNFKCFWEDDYPKLLKEMKDFPIVLYYAGVWNESLFHNTISLVGSRKMSAYGGRVCESLIHQLVSLGFVTISGMAFGIDRKVHIETIKAGGKTLAILANNPYKPSPTNNKDIYNKILDTGGLILSEFNDEELSHNGMFAYRNRIIAGISRATIAIEAGEKSGALITIKQALEYGRETFAIPGDIFSSNSIGTNNAIKDGNAKLVNSIDDILVELGYKKIDKIEKSFNIGDLTDECQKVYTCLINSGKFVEEISKTILLNVSVVVSNLTILELEGLVKKESDGRYYKTF